VYRYTTYFHETYILSARRILGARIAGITGLCGNLKGERAKAIHEHCVQAGVRVEAGDRTLHSLINANGEKVDRAAAEGDVLAVALQTARQTWKMGRPSCKRLASAERYRSLPHKARRRPST